MSWAIYTDESVDGLKLVREAAAEDLDQRARILAALGQLGDRLPQVDDENLFRYYKYLSLSLSFPFLAHYPEPSSPFERTSCECAVLGLLDPTRYASDEFSGIYCRARKRGVTVDLPLLELEVPQTSPNFQLIEDYWYWFWNWR